LGNYKHGFAAKGNHHPLYKKFDSMRVRCESKSCASYVRYGAVGIRICDEWRKDPGEFVRWGLANGWKDGLEIDRIDSTKGYSPDNCRFATRSQNQLNKVIPKNNTSGFRGVIVQRGRWLFKIQNYRKAGFSNKIECALARDVYIISHGIDAPLAFDNIYNNSCNARRVA